MKKLVFFATCAILALTFASCDKNTYKQFVGTWGVEKIAYYNIDINGAPIGTTYEAYEFDPNDVDNSIRLTFKKDRTGSLRDSAIDTLKLDWNEETEQYETIIYCPDTVLVYSFTYSYDGANNALYMNIDYGSYISTFKMLIEELTNETCVYENEYRKHYVEKAYMKRLSKTPMKSGSRKTTVRPHKFGSFLSGK